MDSATVLAGNGAIYLNQHLSLVFISLLPLVVTSCDDNFTGKRDIVFMFDASASVQEEHKELISDYSEDFLKKQVVLRPEVAHLSVIEFYGEHKVLLDGIRNETHFQYECEILGEHWSQLYEHKDNKTGEDGFLAGLQEVTEILRIGRILRHGVKQDLLIFSDAEGLHNPKIDAPMIDKYVSLLINKKVNVYGIGVGNRLDITSFYAILQNNTACYKTLENWKVLHQMESEEKAKVKNERLQPRLTVNQLLCNCSSAIEQCYCGNEFNTTSFVCLKGYEATSSTPMPESNTKGFIVLYVFSGLCGLGVLIGLLFGSKRLYVKFKDNIFPTNNTNSPRPEPEQRNNYGPNSRISEPIYENGIVQEIIDAHLPIPTEQAPVPSNANTSRLSRDASYLQPQPSPAGITTVSDSKGNQRIYDNVNDQTPAGLYRSNEDEPVTSRRAGNSSVIERISGTWRRWQHVDSPHDYESGPSGGETRKVGSGRFRNLRNLFERKTLFPVALDPNSTEESRGYRAGLEVL